MARSHTPSPYSALAFTNNPPNGGITQFTTQALFSGFLASSGSFGVGVNAYESAGKVYIQLYRMYGAIGTYTVLVNTSDGTAINGVDYTGIGNTFITFNDRDISVKTIAIPILRTSSINSSFFNFNIITVYATAGPFIPALANRMYIFTGGNLLPLKLFPSGNYVVGPTSFPVTIIRQGRGTLNFVGTPYSVTRPGGTTTVTLQVQRFNAFKGAVGCSFHTTDGTAVAGVAYTAQSGTLSWADGDAAPKNIVITILNGGSGTQSFTVTIDTPTGGVAIGSVNIATVNIVAAAPPPNPSPGGSIPNFIDDTLLQGDTAVNLATSLTKRNFMGEELISYARTNILFAGFLGTKIGSFIGFPPATGGFGGGTDPVDGTDPFVPPFALGRFKFQAYVN